jgi:hypothetical protein
MANEGIDSPDREPQSPSRSISQKVSMADVLGQTVCGDFNNRPAGASPYDLLSAIRYLLLHSSLWRECARARSLAKEQQSTRALRLQPPRSDCDRSEFLTYVLSAERPAGFIRVLSRGTEGSQLQVSERAKDFAVNRFAAKRSFVDRKKEEAGTNGFPPLVRFSLRLRGLLV